MRDLFATVARLPSGLVFNAMRIAATASGEPAVQCVVCNSAPTKLSCAYRGRGSGGTGSPFHSFMSKHMKGSTHEKALSLMRPPQQTAEQAAAAAGKRRRQGNYAPEDLGLLPARKGPRPAPTERVRSLLVSNSIVELATLWC